MIPKNKILIQLLLVISFLWSSCNKDKEAEILNPATINTGIEAIDSEIIRLEKVLSTETINTNLSIVVTNENKIAINNAEIIINDETYTTNNNGFIVIENIELNKEFQVITTQVSGYTTSIKTITPSSNGVTNVSITLLQPTFEETFDAIEGGTTSNDILSIEFPANAIANQSGDLYQGDVNVTITYYDPNATSFSETIPGTLVGLDDDDTMQALISKGMIKVDLTDTSGNELEIFEGKEATITLPANENDLEIIDFWHLNEEKGIWVQTGTATKLNNTYVATVTHFSTYNLDVKVESIDITFIIKDTNGDLISNQPATITATHSSGTYSRIIITDNLGEFTIINAPKGADFNLDFSSECDDFTFDTGIINETATKELTVEGPLNSRTINIEGTLYNCNNEVFSNKIFFISILNMGKTDVITAYTNAEGKYSTTSLLCNYDTETTYNAEIRILDNLNDIIKDTTLLLDSNNKTINLTTCDGTIETVAERIFDGDYVIDSEDSYLAFIEAGFTKVTGGLTISNITATDLTAFNTLTSVGGLLIQDNEFLTSLEGLENITNIDLGITIFTNPNLVSLVNFSESIDYINSLEISFNDKLINIDGFENIEIGGPYTNTNGEIISYTALAIKNNSALTNISALRNNINDSVGALIFIENNDNLETLSGLEGITQASWISIRSNPLILNLDALSDVTNSQNIHISNNEKLTSINGLNNLTNVFVFRVVSNDMLNNFCTLNTNMISLIEDDGNNDFKSNFQISDNNYNPTKAELLNGDCSQ